ncbi:type VII secretion protein [Cryobacterium roopkundense]|uniref:ESAT-6-like protein n=1 Tax=Cryobacterium roopkundense TaxID=1001240 RepID=A0A099JRL8_9MICO|nr:WXG100 family type VII secretion target [Cryobacterium roopkundense]KGJ80826.1 type VII secretion protein [Cryobacterium roopkundense]MBB5639727.1 WXG100 family type VII secretion target [Cryobacterium roopkundense]
MTSYQVDSEAVLAATGTMRGTIGRIEAEVAGLHSQLLNLEGSWTGQASIAFQGAVADWKAMQQRLEESLASLNQALAAAGQQYADIEQANTRLFAR